MLAIERFGLAPIGGEEGGDVVTSATSRKRLIQAGLKMGLCVMVEPYAVDTQWECVKAAGPVN